MGTWHTVKQGEWLSKIAAQYQITDANTIWNDSHNAQLKTVRDPNLLFPEDRLYIPDKQDKAVSRGTSNTHSFVIKAPPTVSLRITMLNADGTPLAQKKFHLQVGDQSFSGTTTGSGEVIVDKIKSKGDHDGVLDFYEIGLTFEVSLGELNPAHERQSADRAHYDNGVSGIQMRLVNLGFDPGPIDGEYGPQTQDALVNFQLLVMQRSAEEATGELDSDTRAAIIEAHRS